MDGLGHGRELGPSGAPEGKDGMLIGRVARETGVPEHVLRFWEDEEILTPGRDTLGRRRYRAEHLEVIRGVRRAQALGLDLAGIRAFLRDDAPGRAARVRAVRADLEERRREIDASLGQVARVLAGNSEARCPFGL